MFSFRRFGSLLFIFVQDPNDDTVCGSSMCDETGGTVSVWFVD